MAALLPKLQQFVDLRDGSIIGITKATLLSSSDTLTVPTLANSTASASSDQIRNAGEAAVTVTDNGSHTITLSNGTVGDTVTIVSHHRFINYQAEA